MSVPESQFAAKERTEGNESKTIDILKGVYAHSAPAVSSCCFELAQYQLAMFVDEATAPHLHIAGRLARVASLLDPERKDARELLVEIEAILGDADWRLGNYQPSEAHWDIALDYVGGRRTGPGPMLLEELIERAHTLYQEGQYYTSAILFRRAAYLSADQLGPDHPDTLTTRHNLATLYLYMGRREEAESIFKEVLAREEQKLGSYHPNTLDTRHDLALLYMYMGRRQDAEPIFKEVLAKQEQKLDPDHPTTLDTRHNLASLYALTGRHEEAEMLLKEVLAKHEQRVGPDHPDTRKTRGVLDWLRARSVRSDEGELAHEQSPTEGETRDWMAGGFGRLYGVEAPLVGGLAEDPLPGVPEGPLPAKEG